MPKREPWLITIADPWGKWRNAPASSLVRAGVSLPMAMRWARVRRTISPAGLARKARENRN